MSLLLDALQKSERERHAQQAPALQDLLTRATPPSPRRDPLRLLRVLALLAAVGVLGLGATQLWSQRQPPAAVAPTASVITQAEPVVVDASPAADPIPFDPERLQNPMLDEAVVPGAVTAPSHSSEPGATGTREAAAVAAPATAASPAIEQVQEPSAVSASPAAETATAAETSVPSPPPAARPLRDWPAEVRAGFPRLSVEVHAYDRNPLRRFVLVNGKKYREGDTLADGPVLTEITPQGLIVEQGGHRVLIELPRQDTTGPAP